MTNRLELIVLSLRYSSWSMRPWLALTHAGARFVLKTVDLPALGRQTARGASIEAHVDDLSSRRGTGSITGLYPVLVVDGTPIHESLAICEWIAEQFPDAHLWPAERLARAQARAVSAEMATNFSRIRSELSSHLFGHVPGYTASADARREVARVFELWHECLDRSGGPYLFGHFTIADCMYFPMLGRFRTYDVELPDAASRYAETLLATPAVQSLLKTAHTGPAVPAYDEYLRSLGGDPVARL